MQFFRQISPIGAARDLRAVWRADVPRRWLFLLAACIPPAIVMLTFALDLATKSKPLPPTIQYVESWPIDRSMEETLADRAVRAAEMARAEAERKRAYKALGRAVGMDVDAIERDAEARAAAAKKRAASEARARKSAVQGPVGEAEPAR